MVYVGILYLAALAAVALLVVRRAIKVLAADFRRARDSRRRGFPINPA